MKNHSLIHVVCLIALVVTTAAAENKKARKLVREYFERLRPEEK